MFAKLKGGWNWAAGLLIALGVILLLTNHSGGHFNSTFSNTMSWHPYNDSTPYALVRAWQDSARKAEDWTKSRIQARGSGKQILAFGIYSLQDCNTCNQYPDRQEKIDKYYFALEGYYLEPRSSYTIEGSKYLLNYPAKDSGGILTLATREIPVRYSFDVDKMSESGTVLIPISDSTYEFTRVLFSVLYVALLLYGLIVLIGCPAWVLQDIARGKPFHPANSRRLAWTGWSLVAFSVLSPLLSLLFDIIFRKQIPDEIVFPFFETLFQNKTVLLIGLAVLLIASAFRKGQRMTEDQDLTI